MTIKFIRIESGHYRAEYINKDGKKVIVRVVRGYDYGVEWRLTRAILKVDWYGNTAWMEKYFGTLKDAKAFLKNLEGR